MSGDLPPGAVAVTDHRPSTVLIDLIGERLDAGGHPVRGDPAYNGPMGLLPNAGPSDLAFSLFAAPRGLLGPSNLQCTAERGYLEIVFRTAFWRRGNPLAWLFLLVALACAVLMNDAGFRRWLYRGRRPNPIAKVMNRWAAALASRGVASGGLVTLEVTDRRSGRTVSLPLVMVAVGGQRYLVPMLGEDVQWVRNVRAAGGRAVVRGGGREEVLAGRRAHPEGLPAGGARRQVAPAG